MDPYLYRARAQPPPGHPADSGRDVLDAVNALTTEGDRPTEGLFVEGTVGQSEAGLTSFEELSGGAPILSDTDREFTYYNLSLGYNLFPGEVFLGEED